LEGFAPPERWCLVKRQDVIDRLYYVIDVSGRLTVIQLDRDSTIHGPPEAEVVYRTSSLHSCFNSYKTVRHGDELIGYREDWPKEGKPIGMILGTLEDGIDSDRLLEAEEKYGIEPTPKAPFGSAPTLPAGIFLPLLNLWFVLRLDNRVTLARIEPEPPSTTPPAKPGGKLTFPLQEAEEVFRDEDNRLTQKSDGSLIGTLISPLRKRPKAAEVAKALEVANFVPAPVDDVALKCVGLSMLEVGKYLSTQKFTQDNDARVVTEDKVYDFHYRENESLLLIFDDADRTKSVDQIRCSAAYAGRRVNS
jgi:hypothetical protein